MGRSGLGARPNQSLAEADGSVGGATTAHYHRLTEELYLVTAGPAAARSTARSDR